MNTLAEFPKKPQPNQPKLTISASVRSLRGSNIHLVDVEVEGGQLDRKALTRLKAVASLLGGTLDWEKFHYRKDRVDSHELCFEFNTRNDAKMFAEKTDESEKEA